MSDDTLSRLERALDADPNDADAASRLWTAYERAGRPWSETRFEPLLAWLGAETELEHAPAWPGPKVLPPLLSVVLCSSAFDEDEGGGSSVVAAASRGLKLVRAREPSLDALDELRGVLLQHRSEDVWVLAVGDVLEAPSERTFAQVLEELLGLGSRFVDLLDMEREEGVWDDWWSGRAWFKGLLGGGLTFPEHFDRALEVLGARDDPGFSDTMIDQFFPEPSTLLGVAEEVGGAGAVHTLVSRLLRPGFPTLAKQVLGSRPLAEEILTVWQETDALLLLPEELGRALAGEDVFGAALKADLKSRSGARRERATLVLAEQGPLGARAQGVLRRLCLHEQVDVLEAALRGVKRGEYSWTAEVVERVLQRGDLEEARFGWRARSYASELLTANLDRSVDQLQARLEADDDAELDGDYVSSLITRGDALGDRVREWLRSGDERRLLWAPKVLEHAPGGLVIQLRPELRAAFSTLPTAQFTRFVDALKGEDALHWVVPEVLAFLPEAGDRVAFGAALGGCIERLSQGYPLTFKDMERVLEWVEGLDPAERAGVVAGLGAVPFAYWDHGVRWLRDRLQEEGRRELMVKWVEAVDAWCGENYLSSSLHRQLLAVVADAEQYGAEWGSEPAGVPACMQRSRFLVEEAVADWRDSEHPGKRALFARAFPEE